MFKILPTNKQVHDFCNCEGCALNNSLLSEHCKKCSKRNSAVKLLTESTKNPFFAIYKNVTRARR